MSSPAFPRELTVDAAPTPAAREALTDLTLLTDNGSLLPDAAPLFEPLTVEVDPLVCESNVRNDTALAQIDAAQTDPAADRDLKGQWDAYRSRQGASQVPPTSNYNDQNAYVPLNNRSTPKQADVIEVTVESFRVFSGLVDPTGWPGLVLVARRIQLPAQGQTVGEEEPEARTWWQGMILDLDYLRTRFETHLADAERDLETYGTQRSAPALALSLCARSTDPALQLPPPYDRLAVVDRSGIPSGTFSLDRSRGVLHGALALAFLVLGSGSWVLRRILTEESALARRRSDFVAALTHELKAPLTGMRAMVELLHDGLVTDPEKQQEYYGSLLQESERLSRLVRNVLDAARLERSMPLVALARPLDVAPALAGIAQSFRTRVEGAGFSLSMEFADELPLVKADPDALHQIVGNLIDNAAKYGGGTERKVLLSATQAATGVQVRVRDWGPGISPAEQRSVFQRFVRGTSPQEVGGAGLGLAIARAQAASLGASLDLEAVDVGACFCLTLPLGDTSEDASA